MFVDGAKDSLQFETDANRFEETAMTSKSQETVVAAQFGPRAAAYVTSAVHSQGPDLEELAALVSGHPQARVLDLGCGGGHVGFHAAPHVREVVCYDPCYEPFSKLPEGKFDGVICTDVLEHCPEQDLPWIIGELFSYATRFVFANVACFPARKRLPNGENAHCTIQPVAWWVDLVRQIALDHPGVAWEFWVQSKKTTPEGASLVEQKISG